MLEGLEATEISYRTVAQVGRIDAESFDRAHIELANRLAALANVQTIEEIAAVSDGNHLSIANEFEGAGTGVRYLRGQDISGEMMLDDRSPVYIPVSEYDKLVRSHIFAGDVLITIVGANTGQVALVDEAPEKLTANCKLGIIRANSSTVDPSYLHAFLSGRYGQSQVAAAKRGGGQMGLILPDLKALKVPRFSSAFELDISRLSVRAHQLKRTAGVHIEKAETALLDAIGLNNWLPPEPLSYVRSSGEAFAALRLDAEHFQPRFKALIDLIDATGASARLGDCLRENQRGKQPTYAEDGLRVVNSKHVLRNDVRLDADNRFATLDEDVLFIETGDVLLNGTGVGTIGRSAAYLHEAPAIPDNHVTILRPCGELDPVYLAMFLNSQAGQLQVEQRLRGSSGQIELYPNDIAEFRIWLAPEELQQIVRRRVEQSFAQRREATCMLDNARRAIEIAIEHGEARALKYLSEIGREARTALEPHLA